MEPIFQILSGTGTNRNGTRNPDGTGIEFMALALHKVKVDHIRCH